MSKIEIRLKRFVGQRFGRLLVTGFQVLPSLLVSVCDCGGKTKDRPSRLTQGIKKSCGCLARECASKIGSLNRKHGHAAAGTREYVTWQSMLSRCYDKNDPSYKYYGGRGIRVCARWRHSFINFFADTGSKPRGSRADRIEVDGNYQPDNFRYTTTRMSAVNRRNSVVVKFNGISQPLNPLAVEMGVDPALAYNRIKVLGWSAERALSTPLMGQFSHKHVL